MMSGILFDPNGELVDPCAHPDDIVAQMNGERPADNPRPLKRTKIMNRTQSAAIRMQYPIYPQTA